MPVDKLSVFRGTRQGKDGNYNENDGAAEMEVYNFILFTIYTYTYCILYKS